MTTPLLSIVVPTYNRLERLQRVLAAFAAQSCPIDQFEVVVVSDGSTDGTDEFLARYRAPFELVVAAQANQGPAVARNRGVALARGSIVLFVDDDVVAEPELVGEHLASHLAVDDAVVIGPMLTPSDFEMQPWVKWEQAMLYKQYAALEAGVFPATFRQFYTGNASVPRARFLETGGFDQRFRRAEDVELSYRLHCAGLTFVWNPRAVGYHYAERPFGSWLRTARDYGVNEVIFGRDEGQDPAFSRVHAEFGERHQLVRWLARACVAAPVLAKVLRWPLRGIAVAGDALGAEAVGRFALSALFNTEYYVGLAGAMGGAGAFHRYIVEGRDARPGMGSS